MGKGILTVLKVVALPLLLALSACDDVSVFVASGSRSFAIMNSQNLISRSIFRLEWTKEKYADHYDIQIASDPLCEHVVSEIKGLKTTSYDFEALADGKYNLCVFSRTQRTKLAAVNNGLPLTVDQSNPIVTIPSQIRDESQPFIPQISVEDLSEFSILWTKAAGDGTVSISNPQSVNPTLSADKNGVYVITITVTDSLGHKVEQLYSFVWKGSSVPGLTFQSLARSGVASDGSINLSERNDPSPIWILNQSGASSISYSLPQADPSHALACDASQIYDETSIPTAQNLTVEDSYVICVKLSLDDGQTVYGKSDPVVLDLTPPTFTSLANANAAIDGIINNAEKFLVSPMWTLVGSGYTAARYTSAADDSGGALICGSAALYDQTQIPGPSSLTVDGSYALCVELSDAAGNRVYAKSVQIVRASAVPTVNAGADQLTKDPVLLNATATDTTSGISSYAWSKVSGPGTISFSAASSEDTTASASVDGTYVLRLSVTNLDGNTAWDDVIFVWDSTAPTSPSSVSFGSSYAASTNFSMSWVTSSDPHFSTHNTKICTASDCSTGCISPSTSIASPATATGVDGTSYFACVQAVDSLGNASPFISSGASLLVDTSPPLATTLSIAAAAAITSTASNPLTLAATGADQMYITNTASCTSGGTWEAYATSKTWTLGQSNSTATVYAKFRDNAGNESSCLSDSIIHDSQAPTGPTLNISGGATSTTATTVTLSLSASDNSSMEMFVTNTAGCASGGSWESYATSKNWALAQTNATATVFVKYRDAALNETACVNDTITQISASGPSGASVLIENGATTTASPNVSLNLSVSGATDVYITNAAGCVNGGVWETVAATKGWVLSLGATTTATVYVKFRDASMVESSCVSDSIDLTRSSIFSNGDFETGDLSSWTNSIAGRWVVDNSNVDSGSFSAHTVAVANSSTACIQQTVDLSSLTGTFLVTWRWQYDTESGADYARFFTDSTQQFQRSGAPGVWQDESYSLTAGSSTVLKWCYRKNASGQSAGDFVRLDEVKVLSPLLYAPVSLSTTASNAAVALSITPPTGSQTGYLTVRRASSAPSFVPVNGTSYAAGTQGSDQIVSVSSSLTVTDSGLTNGTPYYYAVYSHDANNNYSLPLTTSGTPWGVYAPTALNAVTSNSQLTLNWDNPAGGTQTGFVLVRETGSAVSFNPVNGTSYSPGSVSGGTLVYKGSALTFNDTGLTNGSLYYYTIWSYDGSNNYSLVSRSKSATPVSCPGVAFDNSCWINGVAGSTCSATCTAASMSYDAPALARNINTSSSGTCKTLIQTLGFGSSGNGASSTTNPGLNLMCGFDPGATAFWLYSFGSANNGMQAKAGTRPACPCQ